MKLITNNYKPPVPVKPDWPKTVLCDMCKSRLEIEKADVRTEVSETDGGAWYLITCPACMKEVTYTPIKKKK